MKRYLNSSRDKERDGIQFLYIGVTTVQLSPLSKHCIFSYKHIFILSFMTVYIENTGLWDCSGVLQIGSHITCMGYAWIYVHMYLYV